jgi:hypothetical protein
MRSEGTGAVDVPLFMSTLNHFGFSTDAPDAKSRLNLLSSPGFLPLFYSFFPLSLSFFLSFLPQSRSFLATVQRFIVALLSREQLFSSAIVVALPDLVESTTYLPSQWRPKSFSMSPSLLSIGPLVCTCGPSLIRLTRRSWVTLRASSSSPRT